MSLYGGSSVGWKLSSVWFTITKWHSIIYNNHFLFIITTCSWLGLEERWGQLGGESLGLGTRTLNETWTINHDHNLWSQYYHHCFELCNYFLHLVIIPTTITVIIGMTLQMHNVHILSFPRNRTRWEWHHTSPSVN